MNNNFSYQIVTPNRGSAAWLRSCYEELLTKPKEKYEAHHIDKSGIVHINPRIVDYSYNNGTTTIIWGDGVKTTCHSDSDKADQYTGFMIAVAKHAMGNGNRATNLADYWINKVPAKKLKEEKLRIAKIKEEQRIAEKRKSAEKRTDFVLPLLKEKKNTRQKSLLINYMAYRWILTITARDNYER